MESELILLEKISGGEIEEMVFVPIVALIIYICLVYLLFYSDIDDRGTNILCVLIAFYIFEPYRRGFKGLIDYLHY